MGFNFHRAAPPGQLTARQADQLAEQLIAQSAQMMSQCLQTAATGRIRDFPRRYPESVYKGAAITSEMAKTYREVKVANTTGTPSVVRAACCRARLQSWLLSVNLA